jgi:uncharacterized OB-fold protein
VGSIGTWFSTGAAHNFSRGLVHRLGEVKVEKVKTDMKVEAVFKDPAERSGLILDIKYFKPRQK